MNIFRGRGGPGGATVQEAAARTGHAAGSDGTAVLPGVREPHERQAGRAPGAGAGLPSVAQAGPVAVICRSGNRSRQAAGLLRARGVEAVDAVDVVGGMPVRAAAGLPTVDGDDRAGTVT
ncbi:rhodanese-like domain-containing protein [Streptomyces sp. NPDC127190]|uniref:rhodanese-like domain-containing protein n=1 Tax=unclassified Streptomyces TaxID=2593676 RepID=UPI00363BFF3D